MAVAKSEGKMDLAIYNDPETGVFYTEDVHVDEEAERELAGVVQAAHDR